MCSLLQFNVSANDLLATVNRNAQDLHSSLTNLARLYPSHADSSVTEMSPVLTVRDFEAFAMEARQMTGARVVSYAPLILSEPLRTEWEAYAIAEQSWIEQSASIFYPNETIDPVQPISLRIWLRDGNGEEMIDPGPAPYVPIWQTSPPPVKDTTPINFNLGADTRIGDWIQLQLEQNTTWSFLTEPTDTMALFGEANYPPPAENAPIEPGSLAWIPVEETLLSTEDTLAGAIIADVPWSSLLRNVCIQCKLCCWELQQDGSTCAHSDPCPFLTHFHGLVCSYCRCSLRNKVNFLSWWTPVG